MIDRARAIAEDLLFPAALDVDRADRVPPGHFDALAGAGLYGVAVDDDLDFAGMGDVVAALAGGDLSTAFVWLQHHSPVMAAAALGRTDLIPAFAAGERRAGIALAGLRTPANGMRVRAAAGGFVLDGQVPWVTGWDMIDTLYVAARDDADVIHYLLVDAVSGPTLTAVALDLVAVQASRTVNLTFRNHAVPADALLRTQPFDEWRAQDAGGSTLNGFLAIGVADRCARMLDDGSLADEVATARAALATADAGSGPAARALASEVAMRAAARLTVATGARAVLRDQHAQRLIREAAFLLVFGSRPAIRTELLARLG